MKRRGYDPNEYLRGDVSVELANSRKVERLRIEVKLLAKKNAIESVNEQIASVNEEIGSVEIQIDVSEGNIASLYEEIESLQKVFPVTEALNNNKEMLNNKIQLLSKREEHQRIDLQQLRKKKEQLQDKYLFLVCEEISMFNESNGNMTSLKTLILFVMN